MTEENHATLQEQQEMAAWEIRGWMKKLEETEWKQENGKTEKKEENQGDNI